PPRPTLFPYTTLFRSRQVAQSELKREAGVNPARTRHCKRGAVDEIHWGRGVGKEFNGNDPEPGDLPVGDPRPSSRLRGRCHASSPIGVQLLIPCSGGSHETTNVRDP